MDLRGTRFAGAAGAAGDAGGGGGAALPAHTLGSPVSLGARNTFDQPRPVQVVEGKVERAGMSAHSRLARWSVAVVTMAP